MTLKELQDKKNKLGEQIRSHGKKYHKETGWPSEEDRAAWVQINADYEQVKTELETAQQAEAARQSEQNAIEQRLSLLTDEERRAANTPAGGHPGRGDISPQQLESQQRSLALRGWMSLRMGWNANQQHLQAMERCGISPWQQELVLQTGDTAEARQVQRFYRSHHPSRAQELALERAEQRTLSAITQATGGALVFPSFINQLEVNMLAFGGVRQVAETIVTSHGERMVWPTADDTSNTGAQLGENVSIGSSVDPSFGGVAWDAYKFTSKPVLVPYELMEDTGFDLVGFLGAALGERLGRVTNTKQTTGSGANTCKGIVTAATSGRTAANANAITFDDIIYLEHSIDPAYRQVGTGFMCHDNVILALRLLKDGEGRPLWSDGQILGVPDRLNGKPITVNQDMDSSIATGKKSLLYGQLFKYKIRRVNEVRMYRLQERYRDTDQDGFVAFVREDGNLLTAGTSPVKYIVHP